MKTNCEHIPLYKRAKAILEHHGDTLQDQGRVEYLRYLNYLVTKRDVWGTPRRERKLNAIEAEYPISDIAKAQLDPDVAACVIPRRDNKELPTPG